MYNWTKQWIMLQFNLRIEPDYLNYYQINICDDLHGDTGKIGVRILDPYFRISPNITWLRKKPRDTCRIIFALVTTQKRSKLVKTFWLRFYSKLCRPKWNLGHEFLTSFFPKITTSRVKLRNACVFIFGLLSTLQISNKSEHSKTNF